MRFVPMGLAAAALVLAQPAPTPAQQLQTAGRGGSIAGACGQPQALTFLLPGPLDQTAMAPLSVQIERAEPTYLEFTLSAESRVALRTAAEASDGADPYLALFSAGGAILAQDDDGAGGYDALIDMTLAAGSYCAQLRLYTGGSETRPRITLSAATGEAAGALAVVPPDPSQVDVAQFCTDPALTADLGTVLAPGFGRLDRSLEVATGLRGDLRLSAAGATAFQADTSGSSFDTVLTLTDAAGALIAENDDGPGLGTDSRIAVELQPGDYCLSVRAYDGGGGTTTLVLSDAPDAPIAGDISTACTVPAITQSFGAALAPGLGRTGAEGVLDAGSRRDWTLEVTAPGTYQFDLASADFDSYLTLLDAAGTVLQANDDNGVSVDSRIVADLAPGRYCLAVEALGGAGGGTFSLSASDEVDPDFSGTAGMPGAPACSLAGQTASLGVEPAPGFGSHRIDAEVAPNGRQDWNFSVAEGTSVRFEAQSQAFDTILTLHDAAGGVLEQNDDAPGTTDSLISIQLQPGDYCVTLEGFVGEGGPAQLIVSEVGGAASGTATAERGEVIPTAGSGIEIEELGELGQMLQTNAASPAATKWMAFSVAAGGEVTVNAVSATDGFILRLFAEDGTRLAAVEGTAGLAPAALSATLAPGRYLVAMTLPEDSPSRLRNVVISRD